MDFIDCLTNFYHTTRKTILSDGDPWAQYLLLSPRDRQRIQFKQEILSHHAIKRVIDKLIDRMNRLNAVGTGSTDFHVYGSFYWLLYFLADIGISGNELQIDTLIKKLQLQQLEDGQFLVGYYEKKQQTICYICITAHLGYCLTRLGYGNSTTVAAVLRYIITSQRKDGGWHCERAKQAGESNESAPSCTSANIYIIRFLGQFGNKFSHIVAPAIAQFFKKLVANNLGRCIYDKEQYLNYSRLRYPPHYTGLDILNVINTLSLFPQLIKNEDYDQLVLSLLAKWDGKNWLKTEKRILDWQDFDFSHKTWHSSWITSLFLQALQRVYFKYSA